MTGRHSAMTCPGCGVRWRRRRRMGPVQRHCVTQDGNWASRAGDMGSWRDEEDEARARFRSGGRRRRGVHPRAPWSRPATICKVGACVAHTLARRKYILSIAATASPTLARFAAGAPVDAGRRLRGLSESDSSSSGRTRRPRRRCRLVVVARFVKAILVVVQAVVVVVVVVTIVVVVVVNGRRPSSSSPSPVRRSAPAVLGIVSEAGARMRTGAQRRAPPGRRAPRSGSGGAGVDKPTWSGSSPGL